MASSSFNEGDLYSDEWVPPEHATEEEIKELIADRNYEKHGSAFEAEDVHWLNSREAVNKAFEQAIAREDREDLQEFRSRAAASTSRNPPTSQIAMKEKEDSLFVPGSSKQMSILSRLGIKRKGPEAAGPAAANAAACGGGAAAAPQDKKAAPSIHAPPSSNLSAATTAAAASPAAGVHALAASGSGLSALLDYDDCDD